MFSEDGWINGNEVESSHRRTEGGGEGETRKAEWKVKVVYCLYSRPFIACLVWC